MDLDIPLYSAAFVDTDLLVVAGGGGRGKHGLGNKVVLLDTADKLKQVAEHAFPDDSDCPMSMTVQDKQIIVGVNGPEPHGQSQAQSQAQSHAQVFSTDLVPGAARSLFTVKGAYQRSAAASLDHVAAVGAANSGDSPLVVLDAELKIVWETNLKTDLRDISFNQGRLLAALEPSKVHFYESETGKESHTLAAPQGGKFSRGQFISDTKYVAAVQFPAKKRVELQLFEIEDKPMLVTSTRVSLPSVSALATNGEIIAVGSASGEVQVFNARLAVLQRPKAVHKLPVSAVAVSSNGNVASTSVSGSVHLFVAPFGERSLFGGFAVAWWTFLSVAVLAVLAALVHSRIQTLAISAASTTSTAGATGAVETGDLTLTHITAGATETVVIYETTSEPATEPEVDDTVPEPAVPEPEPAVPEHEAKSEPEPEHEAESELAEPEAEPQVSAAESDAHPEL